MYKADLIALLAKKSGMSQVAVKGLLEIFGDVVVTTLKKEKRFAVSNFGVFEVVKRKKRLGRNPKTLEEVVIKSHRALKFRPAKWLRETIKGSQK